MIRPPSLARRSSGVLLHLTSLPGGHGIGDLGPESRRFARLLKSSEQSFWQMLPVNPPGFANSPYMALSAFAGNPYLISLDDLVSDGLLTETDVKDPPRFPAGRVDFPKAIKYKGRLLEEAFLRFEWKGRHLYRTFRVFCEKERGWLDDYALFMVLKEAYKNRPWWQWLPGHRDLQAAPMQGVAEAEGRQLMLHKFLQFIFFRQWGRFRNFCSRAGVGLIGDVPIFVAHDSADVWAHRGNFQVQADGRLEAVAGVPPDYFSRTGQLWGNPLYRWDVMARSGYSWWMERLRLASEMFDAVRLDHFIGYYNYWSIPAGAKSATVGRWVKGPGADFLRKVRSKLPSLHLIAEDLGVVVPGVKALRDRFGLPGMKVLQFAFGNDPERESYQPHNYTRNCVVYTGTHDNDTTVGWFRDKGGSKSTRTRAEIRKENEFALKYLGSRGGAIHFDMMRLAMMSVANVAVIPAADVLGLDTRARMNQPGTLGGNWEWRMGAPLIPPREAERLKVLTLTYDRGRRIRSEKWG